MSDATTTDQPTEPSARLPESTVPLGCSDCGEVFTKSAEARVQRCPRCGSPRCHETLRRVAGALLSTDGSLDDSRFARVVLWDRLITSRQFAECVEEQESLAAAGNEVPSLAQLLIRKGYIQRAQAEAVLRAVTTRTPQQWRDQFGQFVLRKGFITEEQLRECLKIQTKLILSAGSAPVLAHLLIERGYLSEVQALAILKAQERRRNRALHEIQSTLRPGQGRIARFLQTHRRKVRIVVFLAAVAAAGAVGRRLFAHITAPPTFALTCAECGHRVRAQAAAIAQSCPRCGKGEMCTPLWCAQCRLAFPLKVHTADTERPWIEACPTCGTLEYVKLPPGLAGLAVRPRATEGERTVGMSKEPDP